MATRPDYQTKEPVTDLLLALHLLEIPWGGNSHRYLITTGDGILLPTSAEIRIDFYGGGYTKDEYQYSDNYRLDPAVASLVLAHGFMQEIKDGEPGTFYLNFKPGMSVFQLLDEKRWRQDGKKLHDRLWEERETAAKQFFKPMIHSTFSSVLQPQHAEWKCAWDDENYRSFQVCFHYHLPGREWVRICEDGKVEFGKLAAA